MSMKTIIACLASALAGVAFVLSCSDDAPGTADAAVCDCPAAEPPLAGRLVDQSQQFDLPANTLGNAGVDCPVGSTLLYGGCEITGGMVTTHEDVALVTSAKAGDAQSWNCLWQNNSASILQGTARVTCLTPAP
jgi:hypothetical protein